MNVSEFVSNVPARVLKDARLLELRELEVSKDGSVIATVETGEYSYSVSVQLDKKQHILSSWCECGEEEFCVHKIALLNGIVQSRDKSGKTKKKKHVPSKKIKLTEAERLISELPEYKVIDWLTEYFKTNKDAELQFVMQFAETGIIYTPDEVSKIISEIVQSVAGRRKTASASENKKISTLLLQALEPIYNFVFHGITKPVAFEVLMEIGDTLTERYDYLYRQSVRYKRILDDFVERFALQINQISIHEVWAAQVARYYSLILNYRNHIPDYILKLGTDLYTTADETQKKHIGLCISSLIVEKWEITRFTDNKMLELVLTILIETQLFEPVKHYFEPRFYANSYNLKLLEELKKTDPERVASYCYDIIKENVNEKYNAPYYEILARIYTDKEDYAALAYIKKWQFNFVDINIQEYQFIIEHLEDAAEVKKFRNRVLASLKTRFWQADGSDYLYFKILGKEQNLKKMISVIDRSVSAEVISEYLDKLYNYNKDDLFKVLAKRWGQNWYPFKDEADIILLKKVVQLYGVSIIPVLETELSYTRGSHSFNEIIEKLT